MTQPVAPVRIVWIEDSPEDVELFSSMLIDDGLDVTIDQVDDEAGLQRALSLAPELVISDVSLPGFSGELAFEIVKAQAPRTPFVYLSGAMGEDAAVLALHRGATDYVLKQNPLRLPAAVRRALTEGRAAQERDNVMAELLRVQRNDAIALVVAGLSHDLRNVLQPLVVLPHILRKSQEPAAALRAAAVIEESVRRGQDLVHAVICYARGDAAVDACCTAAEVLDGVRLLLTGTVPGHLQVQFDEELGDTSLRGASTQLQQCVLNLCLNSVQAMQDGQGSQLRVCASRCAEPDMARITVADDGGGMPEGIQARLFTPFFTTKQSGTGLGLLSCRQIMEQLGGRMEIDSGDHGTRVHLYVPFCPE
ncbi:sensor histidine kinase [Lysobacter korlensis]|uniref:histidine kinase n=1 Tax=Lysobacter korlensis TaxID=553636 RepID=A0ABV6RRG8_9GAMM